MRCLKRNQHKLSPVICKRLNCYQGDHGDEGNCHSPLLFYNDQLYNVCGRDCFVGTLLEATRNNHHKIERDDENPGCFTMSQRVFNEALEQQMGEGVNLGGGYNRYLDEMLRYVEYDPIVYWSKNVSKPRLAWTENMGQILVVNVKELFKYVCDPRHCVAQDCEWNERFRQCPFFHVADHARCASAAMEFFGVNTSCEHLMRFVFGDIWFMGVCLVFVCGSSWRHHYDLETFPAQIFLPGFAAALRGERVAAMVTDMMDFIGLRAPQAFSVELEYPWAEETLRESDGAVLGEVKLLREFVLHWWEVQQKVMREQPKLLKQPRRISTVQFRIAFENGNKERVIQVGCRDGDTLVELLRAEEERGTLGTNGHFFGKGYHNGILDCSVPTRFADWSLCFCF